MPRTMSLKLLVGTACIRNVEQLFCCPPAPCRGPEYQAEVGLLSRYILVQASPLCLLRLCLSNPLADPAREAMPPAGWVLPPINWAACL